MYDVTRDLLDAFRATPETLTGLLRGCSQEEAMAARGGDENWSIVEVVCHLRDAEERALERTRLMRDEDHPYIAAYDQEQLARERDYAHAQLAQALESFAAFRAEHISLLAGLAVADWQRSGRHQEQGDITIQNHAQHMAAHDAIHCAQIARQRQSAQS